MFALGVVGLLWFIELIDYILPANLDVLGIIPRETRGLKGIVLSPFLHGGWKHLISNSVPLLVLLTTVLTFYKKVWLQVTIFSALIGGVAVWAFARTGTVHIGASGVIFSLITFLLASGVFRKNIKAILIALVILFLYGGALWGVIPGQEGISWEGHLFGAIAGIILAWVYKGINKKQSVNAS